MNTTTTQPVSLKVSRLIKAPRERVFAAWTTPADIMKWLGCDTTVMQSAKIDLRIGGEYRFAIKSERGEKEITGKYREIKPPGRLVFTWLPGNCNPGMEGAETLVTIDLIEQKGGTLVQITHEGFPTAESRDQHEHGWNGCLDKMEKLV